LKVSAGAGASKAKAKGRAGVQHDLTAHYDDRRHKKDATTRSVQDRNFRSNPLPRRKTRTSSKLGTTAGHSGAKRDAMAKHMAP
jgi:hypothetical protein